ncbi:ribonuclease R [Runella sp.]|jgi:ribonuclease R|uniref:ribonuclease R n=1 Tax=Runella sp. TaxID=1960881 RepID=UPI0026100B18|nr:ribonuclease R [Runella sp.]
MKKNQKSREPKKRQARPQKKIVSFLDEFKSEIAAFFEINNEQPFELQQLHDHFDADDQKLRLIFNGLLDELIEEERIKRTEEGLYSANESANVLIGRVEHVNKNYAFVVLDSEPLGKPSLSGSPDVWIDSDDLRGAVDGDTVRITLFSDYRSGRRREGRVEEVLQRGRTEFVGELELWPKYGIVSLDNRRMYEEVHISESKLKNAQDGDKVLIHITQYPTRSRRMEGEVVEVLGKAGSNETEMHAILAEFGLPYKFPEEIEAEANAIPETISVEEIARRRDMRDILTFTIDPTDAKDFDDAISVKYLDNGNYEIGVHIADVTHYVRPNTGIEREAYARATSVYLVDRTVPMLPEKLSNNLCSLRPNEDKLTFSAVFELNEEAKIINEWFGRTVIHSDRRFSYEEAQEVLENPTSPPTPLSFQEKGNLPPSPERRGIEGEVFSQPLTLLNKLAHKLRAERFAKGAVNFETTEVKFNLDENGKPLGLYTKIRKDAHKLIEEFMLLANKRVPEFIHRKSKDKNHPNTMIYRIHEEPDMEKLRIFAAFTGRLGYKMKIENEKIAAQSLNQLMEDLEGKPEQNALEQLAIRTMAKARYSTEDVGHFGLAFRRYSHFTSPIRRYPDMIAHRLLQHYLDGKPAPERAEYEPACKHSSSREQLAANAERASIKYKQVEFMASMEPNREWDGIITGVTEFGIFVEITETASEGLVRMNDLNDDYYELDKENYRLVGKRSKRFYTFGDAVKVKVKETNISRRSMDLVLANATPMHSGGSLKSERNFQRSSTRKEKGAAPKERKRRR